MDNIEILLWDENQLKNSHKEWSNLLGRSDADKLFMSWEWMSTWWSIFAERDDAMQLKLIIAVNSIGELIGIAPLYLTTRITKKYVKTRQLQFLGNCWRGQATMRTELQGFIVDKAHSKQVIKAIYLYINSLTDWDELILSDLDKNSETYSVLNSEKLLNNTYYRHAE